MWLAAAIAAPIGQIEVYAPSPEARAEAEALGLVFAEGVDGPWVTYHGREPALLAAQAALATRNVRADHRTLLRQDGYHTPDTLNARLLELAEDPRATLVQVGVSVQGRPLYALKMGTGPAWRILGAHHGDELSSSEVGLAVAEALLGEHEALLERRSFWVMPAVNPDGMVAGSRYNANEVDLNRNYGFQWETGFTHGSAPFSEPETQAVRTLSLYTPFVAGLSLHSGAENIGYPWNYTYEDSPDHGRLHALGQIYVEACDVDGFYVTNGADWYPTWGDTNDWSFGRQGTWDYTLELSEVKSPPSAELPSLVEAHVDAIVATLWTEVALQGQVTDAVTGNPLQAFVEVRSSSPLWSGPDGRFARMLDVGVYELTVSAPGYAEQTLNVGVPAEGGVRVDVALQPEHLADWSVLPRLVSQASDEVIVEVVGLDPAPRWLTLSRPGFESVEIERKGGVYPLGPASLEQGPWTLEAEGQALPNGLLVGAPDGRVVIEDVLLQGDVWLSGQGFGVGSRAFWLAGPERALVELDLVSEIEGQLRFDATGLPEDGTVDLLVLTNGRELAVVDLLGTPVLDTGDFRTQDTGEDPPPGDLVPAGYRGCMGVPGSSAWVALLAGVALRRRRA